MRRRAACFLPLAARGRLSKRNYFTAHTTFRSRSDYFRREELCDALRASGKTGIITPVYLYCADGARCTVCRQGSGGHR